MLPLFAVVLPLVMFLMAMTFDIGNWFVHARHLQTKVDAGAFGGGGSWEFPCGPAIDARIEDSARLYVGAHTKVDGSTYTTPHNPQVGKTETRNLHVVLNGIDWFDEDSNPNPIERTDPANASICESMTLDVKGTESNNTPLFGWIPFYPDIKRHARVEIQEVEGVSGLLPIAVRAPDPVGAAVFYNEADGTIRSVKYFVKNPSIFGLPGSLQGWSTYNSLDSDPYARFAPTAKTGVVIALSLRGACNTNLPNSNPAIVTSTGSCFEDEGFTTVDQLCNQGATPVVECHYATGTSTQTVQMGLHFIRGYEDFTVAAGRPEIESAWLENVNCTGNGYFSSIRTPNPCQAKLTVKVDVGSLIGNPPGPPNANEETRTGANTQMRYCLVRATSGNLECENNQFRVPQDMNCSGMGVVTCSTVAGKHLSLPHNSLGSAVAIEVKMRHTTVAGGPPGCTLAADYNDNCRWFYTGNGFFTTDTPPTTAQVMAAPVQRSFRGNRSNASLIQWLRLTADQNCDGTQVFIDHEAASQPIGGNRCFFMDMGLKGGLALDADEPAIVFDDGSGSSQTGAVDCDPNIAQGQMLITGIDQGCGPWYARHPFDWTPECPSANNLFTTPNPGSPWNDGRWPPLRCIKTRPSSSANQFDRGFNLRLFDDETNPQCPSDAAGFVKGRNYWDQDTNPVNNRLYGYKDDSPARDTHFHPDDPRIVTIFLTTNDGFIGSGQETYPITGFVEVYVTGYGRINGSGNLTVEDPCPGSTPPPAAEWECSGSECGSIVWGHFINYRVPNPQATPSGRLCQPGISTQPCVATLVE